MEVSEWGLFPSFVIMTIKNVIKDLVIVMMIERTYTVECNVRNVILPIPISFSFHFIYCFCMVKSNTIYLKDKVN